MLVSNHREHIAHHYDEHVAMHLEELTGASHFTDSGRFELAFNPSDPRYYDLYSGWYWEVKQGAKTLKRSESLVNILPNKAWNWQPIQVVWADDSRTTERV